MAFIGQELDSFKVTAWQDLQFKDVTEETIKEEGKWNIFFFYPADFTFVCPTELGDMQDHYLQFIEAGCEVYSVSTDTHFTHKAWWDNSETIKKITYPMIGDPAWKLASQLDMVDSETGLANRGTFVFDPDGKLQIFEVCADGVGRDASELLRKVKAAIYVRNNPGQVCPAKWKQGEATLAPTLDLVGKI